MENKVKMNNSEITDFQFWEVIKASTCNYSLAANLFQERYGVSLTRSTIKQRAELEPIRIKQIQDEYLDSLEDILFLSAWGQNPIAIFREQDREFIKQVVIRVLTRPEHAGINGDEIADKLKSKIPE